MKLLSISLVFCVFGCIREAAPTRQTESIGQLVGIIGGPSGMVNVLKFKDKDVTCYVSYRENHGSHSISCLNG